VQHNRLVVAAPLFHNMFRDNARFKLTGGANPDHKLILYQPFELFCQFRIQLAQFSILLLSGASIIQP